MSGRGKRIRWYLILLAVNLAVIWGNSLLPAEESANLSGFVSGLLQRLWAAIKTPKAALIGVSVWTDGNTQTTQEQAFGGSEEKKLQLRVQIIDRYFGILIINIAFKDENRCSLRMMKQAEDFLNEYQGWLNAIAQEK